ncbi:hypothetical protein OPV22_002997 [Ensete ventricosum]|uniref:DUF7887 domain-containing protein n=1 Tax=Ensete ventricosum TaxID=4639 RepID=A0AAV8RZJ1_ENSVE|nr:hypothetical protein OPV22_002997 [Ensete ventricosum]
MIVSGKSFASRCRLPHLLPCSRNRRQLKPARAKKENIGGDSQAGETTFSLRASKAVLARSAVALFGLGFLDAGYSGDWSRIGVISKETEDLLKIAAYLVTPLCLLLIFYVSDASGHVDAHETANWEKITLILYLHIRNKGIPLSLQRNFPCKMEAQKPHSEKLRLSKRCLECQRMLHRGLQKPKKLKVLCHLRPPWLNDCVRYLSSQTPSFRSS